MIALQSSSFRWLLASGVATYLGTGMQMTATAWIALDGGAFNVGLVLAARMLPFLLFGLVAGTFADRANRGRVVVIVRVLALAPAIGMAWYASAPGVGQWVLVLLSFGTGAASVFDMPARQALVLDTTPREVGSNAMALNATVSRISIALGALVAGALIPAADVTACFLVIALIFVVAALLGLLVHPRSQASSTLHAQATFGQALREAARLAVDVREVRTLVLAAVACEVLGFSYQTAVPAFARDVLGTGAAGLGSLNAAAAIGGALALVVLSLVPGTVPRQPLLGLNFILFGVSMLGLAASGSFAVAATALIVIGACAASFDVLQQTLMQLAVPDHQRGRAVGLWVFGIGSAPLGSLLMGALVAALGAPAALAINGGLVLIAAMAMLIAAPDYRRTRRASARP